ncbi:MAG: HD domain-containing phosphohydrolase [Candidatus Zipacnadales bacterium]
MTFGRNGRRENLEFSDLPRSAKLLIIGMCGVGFAALVGAWFASETRHYEASLIYIALAFFASSQRLQMHPRLGTMSPGFVFVFAALLQCGTAIAVVAAVASALGGLFFTAGRLRRQPLPATLYAIGSLALAAWSAGTVFDYLCAGNVPTTLTKLLGPATAAISAYYGISVASLGAISVAVSQKLSSNWLPESLWLAPVYVAGGTAALTINAAYDRFGPAVFLLGLPIIYVVQRAYTVRAQQTKEKLRYLEERTQASEKVANLYLQIVEALSTAIEAKDQGTRLHVRRVQGLAVAVAQRVGLTGPELLAVERGAILHDIGKLGIPDHVLSKPSRLTEEEYRMVQEHPAIGEAVLRPIDFGADVAAIVRHHHEKMDGSGYPDGLVGDQIPMGARVLAVIDVYDALVSDRPYRKAWHSAQAVAYLREHAPAHFDPQVVEALVEVLESGEISEQSAPKEEYSASRKFPLPHKVPYSSTEAGVYWPNEQKELHRLADQLVSSQAVHTCVVYEVDRRNSEIEAVYATGTCAAAFERLRIPLGAGPSATVARTGRLVVQEAATAEFDCVVSGVPLALADSVVSAVPAITRTGRVIAVVSLYSDAHTAPPNAISPLLMSAAVAAAEIGERLPAAQDESRTTELLEYAAFLAALAQEVERAAQIEAQLVVLVVQVEARDQELRDEQLLRLAQELRICGRGRMRVVERPSSGELVAMLPAIVEASARECIQKFVGSNQTASPGEEKACSIKVGSAVYPTEATSAHGLITLAQVRLAEASSEVNVAKAEEEKSAAVPA